MTFDITKIPTQEGKVAIVTGANNGLGFETTKALARKKVEVVMACRNLDKAEAAKTQILKGNKQAKLRIMELDLSKMDSVREFAKEFTGKYDRLDFLINNAGIMMPPHSLTKDGFESQLATNYLGHFLLTKLVFPIVKKTEHARVVSLSSLAHKWHEIQFDDMNFKKSYNKRNAYSQSKLACLMFGIELDRRLRANQIKAISVTAHPGVSDTNLSSSMPKFVHFLATKIGSLFLQSAADGAKPTLYAALGEDINGGDYTGPDGKGEMKGEATKVRPRKLAQRNDIAEKLWSKTEEMLGEKFEVA